MQLILTKSYAAISRLFCPFVLNKLIMSQYSWKRALSLLAIGAVSAQASTAGAANGQVSADTSVEGEGSIQLAQANLRCEEGTHANFYAQIATNSGPLLVRSVPAGTVVGAIPKGWTVIVLEQSDNGQWSRVASRYAKYDSYRAGSSVFFGNAPDFSEGWVSTAYLKHLGRFCEKPMNVSQLLQTEIFGQRPVEVQSDWLAMGDMLAEQQG